MPRKSVDQILKELEGPMKSSEKTLKAAQKAQSAGTVRGNNVQGGARAKAEAAAKEYAARKKMQARSNKRLDDVSKKGLGGRRKAIDRLY
jgi:hypothetical protein